MTETDRTASQWYTRRDGTVYGPFPAGLIRRHVILGRLVMDDELSRDLETWTRLKELPELVPEIIRDAEHGRHARERLLAARRWEDERSSVPPAPGEVVDSERRDPAGETGRSRSVSADSAADTLVADSRHRLMFLLAAAVVIIAAFFLLTLSGTTPDEAGPDCLAAAQPGINWNGCAMEGRVFIAADLRDASLMNMSLTRADLTGARLGGADLSFTNLSVSRLRGADLEGARLMGANLRASDLSNAGLEHADLSYADLQNANLDGTRLAGARFDHAIWIDGVTCLPGSVGACLAEP